MLYNANMSSNRKNRMARPDVAAVRTAWITQGIGVFIWNMFFLNPVTLPWKTAQDIRSLIQGGLYATGQSTQLRGMTTSSLMHWLTLPFVFGARALIDGHIFPDDEEELDRELSWHLENVPYAGYGVIYTWNAMLTLFALMDRDKEMFIDKAEQATSLFYGRPQLGFFKFLQKGTQETSKALLDIFYEITD